MALARRVISSKRQNILTAIMVLVIVVTAVVAYYGLFSQPKAVPIITEQQPVTQLLTTPLPENSGLDALEKFNKMSTANQLKKFGTWPMATEPKGKSALFVVPVVK